MSSYLGIEPTKRPDFYFVSYSNGDAVRLMPLMKQLVRYNIPIWYDYGLEYGEQWQKKIADQIQDCQAMLLFLTKEIFQKKNSYVVTEYEMATKYFEKAVYVILIDDIQNKDVPNSLLGWWIDISRKQSLLINQYPETEKLMEQFKKMLKISNLAERTENIMKQYKNFIDKGELKKAERLLDIILHGKELETKAKIIAKFYSEGYAGLKAINSNKADKGTGNVVKQQIIGNCKFQALSRTVFHRSGRGDADVLEIKRNDERIYTIGGLVEASDGFFFYEKEEDLLYIMYYSWPNINDSHPLCKNYLSVCVIENPCEEAVVHVYRNTELEAISLGKYEKK